MIVVDTNLVAYLLIAGANTELAERVWVRDADWGVPLLMHSEFRNVLVRRVQTGTTPVAAAVEAAQAAEAMVAQHEFQPHGEHVLRLAAASGCTAYDCEFVAVARDLGVPLVTFDQDVLRAFPGTAVHPADFLQIAVPD